MPRWKQIFQVLPASFEILEQQLAQTIEQAFWALGSDPKWNTKELESSLTAPKHHSKEVALEPWMIDDTTKKPPATVRKATKKQQRPVAASRFVSGCHSLASDVSDQTASTCNSSSDHNEEDMGFGEDNGSTDGGSDPIRDPEASAVLLLRSDMSVQTASKKSSSGHNDDIGSDEDKESTGDGSDTIHGQETVEILEQQLRLGLPASIEAPKLEAAVALLFAPSIIAYSPAFAGSGELAYVVPANWQGWHLSAMAQRTPAGNNRVDAQLLGMDAWIATNNFEPYRDCLLEYAQDIADFTMVQEQDCIDIIQQSGMPTLAGRRFRNAIRSLGASVLE